MPDTGDATLNALSLDVGWATDVGRVREANEDSMLALSPGDGKVLVAVADGMGGHKAGEVASHLAVKSLRAVLESATPSTPAEDVLTSAVELANRTIWEAASGDEEKEGMGTTLVCAMVSVSGDVAIANVGDSRAYSVKEGAAQLVTVDHTWVNEQVLDGQMSEREARVSPYRNLLTRTLGGGPRVQVDLFKNVRLGSGDALVLVSDGVTSYLDSGDVGRILRECATAQESAERLVSEAVSRGGADNATAVVVVRRD
ncbi:MAG TPA: PP2C family serine/threonine-protein phosphatase [Chloroflexota bacterium]|nr:PP2C family serine/threonine-protein phosphatase [Chloroflexota bacterium]